jgi:hypothetical protein
VGRAALSVEAHLWVRELTRIDRAAGPTAVFRWGDDGPPTAVIDAEDVRPSFPALYCRRCGRSGWGVGLAPVGGSLSTDDESIRRDHANREGRFRPLLPAAAEAEAVSPERSLPSDPRSAVDGHMSGVRPMLCLVSASQVCCAPGIPVSTAPRRS